MQWDVSQTHHYDRKYDKERVNIDIWMPGQTNYCANESRWRSSHSDLEFVKKFTRPNFQVQEFYTLKTRESRLFSPEITAKMHHNQ